mgnify:CR=1 FL=1
MIHKIVHALDNAKANKHDIRPVATPVPGVQANDTEANGRISEFEHDAA